ncbi:YybH family protein [Motilibacter aurantiacus]|uniref:YybH family protein n=1 Tax=Motilibacter aurantiacus TaxID=2714955 RepID=UPI001E588535|nr:nuclear transport factor 2 family protein [Motilibacter aurantiacus]
MAALTERCSEAADAYIRGDVWRYLSLSDHPSDYTLMPPYGGPTSVGLEYTEEAAQETSRLFASGEATPVVVETYVSGDLVVLAGVERQHAEVGGLPDQDWSLRLTIEFRRRGFRWQIVLRHADPLVRAISIEHCAGLARGSDG